MIRKLNLLNLGWPILVVLVWALCLFDVKAQNPTQQMQLANEYYGRGEIEKAKSIYQALSQQPNNLPLIHTNYFNLLMANGYYEEATTHINSIRKTYPSNLGYQIDEGILLEKTEGDETSNAFFSVFIEEVIKRPNLVRTAAQQFVQKQRSEWAIDMYLEARERQRDDRLYSLELATVYRYRNEVDSMVVEYLNYLGGGSQNNLSYVENILQNVLREEEDFVKLEQTLYGKVQDEPENRQYAELLVWTLIQQKQFYAAYVQARALDKRFGTEGDKSMAVGSIALKNEDWDTSKRVFEYVIATYPGTLNYIRATHLLVKTREAIVRNRFPVEREEVRSLVSDYQSFIKEITLRHPMAMEAVRSEALLHAFYLDEEDTARQLLQSVLNSPTTEPQLRGQCKLDLGDIYLLQGEPWESTLLYSQVEKEFKESALAYEAKLRNAKLSFYKGEFLLAGEHLDVLKMATTREIANDALALGLLISDNIAMDTTEKAMRRFAEIDLMLFQNKFEAAMAAYEEMLVTYPEHSLTDEIWWRQADIHRKMGRFSEALILLNKIVEDHTYDILSDDAYFLMAQINERQLMDTTKAQELYQDFLLRFPGSIFTSEARKRFRELRGDFIN